MKEYVLGFLFSEDCSKVALIKKLKPAWQLGFLNGIGGKLEESDNTIAEAQTREFQEEAGILIAPEKWHCYHKLIGKDFKVHVFKAFSNNIDFVRTKTEEKVGVYEVSDLKALKTISNLHWLIPMAFDTDFHNGVTYYE